MSEPQSQLGDVVPHETRRSFPIGWVLSTLEEACVVIQGQSPPGTTYNTNGLGLPFLQGKAEFTDLYPKAVKWCSAPSKIAEPDDVLISIRAPVGPTNLCAVQSCIGRGLAAIRTQGDMPAKYILYAMRATEEDLRANSTGTTFEAIRGNDLRSHPFPLPPLAEQNRIVAEIEKQFTRLNASVAALKRVQANLKRYRASVLKAACEGKLVPTEAEVARAEGRDYEPANQLLARILAERRARWEAQEKRRGKYVEPSPPDPSDLPELPEGWAWATVAQLAEIQGGIQKQPKRAPADNPFPFLRVANALRGSLDLQEVHKIELFSGELDKLRLFSGDLLIVEGNGSPSQIGRMAIWKGEIEDCVHQNHIIRARLYSGLIPQYVESYWNSPIGASGVSKVASSTSGLYTLSVSKVSDLPVPLPPLAEQHRIIAEVERRLSVVQQAEGAVEVNLTRAERLRQSILKQAFSGKLIPQDPNDEPASALLERIRVEREASHTDAKKSRQTRPRRGKSLSARQFVLREGNP